MLVTAGLGAFNVIPLRTAYFTLIILVAVTVCIRITRRIISNDTRTQSSALSGEIIASLCILGFAFLLTARSDKCS